MITPPRISIRHDLRISVCVAAISVLSLTRGDSSDPLLQGFPEARMIHMAAQAGDVEAVEKEVSADPEAVHARTVANITALHLGAEHPEVVKVLLKHGAQCDSVDINTETPIMIAARNGWKGSIDALLEHKPNLSVRRNDGYTALMLAVLKDQVESIPALLQADPDPNAMGPDGHSAITMAAARAVNDPAGGALKAVLSTRMPKGRLDVNQAIESGKTALMIVANNNQKELVKLLLDAGASAAGFDSDGSTPLMHAVNGACDECVRLILEQPSGSGSVNERDRQGWSALMLASRSFHGDEMVPLLLAHGADSNARKRDGITPLMLAAGQNRSYSISGLLDAGADPTAVDKKKWTALHIAASRGFFKPIELLLEGGASQTALNEDFATPFGLAVDNNVKPSIKAFREYNGEAYINGSAVVEVNRQGFKELLEKAETPILMQFFAPWCEHCKKFAPVYEEVAKTLAVEGNIVVAKADAATDADLAGQHGVEAFPTIKWFPKGSNEGEKWPGARMYDAVMHFVSTKTQ